MYLSALAAISEDPIVGKEELQMVVMMERSMDRYTLGAYPHVLSSAWLYRVVSF
jgi:hypothetical protein